MIEWLQHNWFLVGALGTLLGFSLDKGYNFWKDRKEKQQAYNRLFTAVIKMYASFIKHGNLYNDEPFFNLPDEMFVTLSQSADTFSEDLITYQKAIDRENNLLPEIAIQANELFTLLDTVNLVNKISLANPTQQPSPTEILKMKRAYFYMLDEKLNIYFKDTLNEIRKNASLSKEFSKIVDEINSEKDKEEQHQIRISLLKRYFESLVRQGLMPVEFLTEIENELLKPKELN